jgi:peptide/nickel transport system substrate-binding protein
MRRAFAQCINREAILEEVLAGLSALTNSYLPTNHPLYSVATAPLSEDVEDSIALLEAVGWIDHDFDPSTPRRARGVLGILDGTVLQVSHLTTDSGFHQAVAERLAADLDRCGIELVTTFEPSAVLFQPWQEGPAFGRSFQLVSWAWPSWVSPICEMFHSRNIPSDDMPDGFNASGFRNDFYDFACDTVLLSNPEGSAYQQAVQTTQEIFSEALPAVPLYMRPRVIAHRIDLCGVEVDPTVFSTLWAIESFYRSASCEGIPYVHSRDMVDTLLSQHRLHSGR